MSAPLYFVTAPSSMDRCPEDRDGRGCYLLVGLAGPLEEMLRRDESSTELLEPCVADVCFGLRTLGADGRGQSASGSRSKRPGSDGHHPGHGGLCRLLGGHHLEADPFQMRLTFGLSDQLVHSRQ